MKDLGYKRTPTTATMRVEMPDGSPRVSACEREVR